MEREMENKTNGNMVARSKYFSEDIFCRIITLQKVHVRVIVDNSDNSFI